jgi:hypothetical protein
MSVASREDVSAQGTLGFNTGIRRRDHLGAMM